MTWGRTGTGFGSSQLMDPIKTFNSQVESINSAINLFYIQSV